MGSFRTDLHGDRDKATVFMGDETIADHKWSDVSDGAPADLRKPLPSGHKTAEPETEARLDAALEETFPASDPVPINPGSH